MRLSMSSSIWGLQSCFLFLWLCFLMAMRIWQHLHSEASRCSQSLNSLHHSGNFHVVLFLTLPTFYHTKGLAYLQCTAILSQPHRNGLQMNNERFLAEAGVGGRGRRVHDHDGWSERKNKRAVHWEQKTEVPGLSDFTHQFNTEKAEDWPQSALYWWHHIKPQGHIKPTI